MNKLLLLLLLLLNKLAFAQFDKENIYNSWVITQITYKDGSPLPDDNILKYSYIKYTFDKPNFCYYSAKYSEKGSRHLFELYGDQLTTKSAEGSIMNQLRVEELSANKLVLLQQGATGFDDPAALKFTYVSEANYQQAIPLTADLMYAVTLTDTVYRQSPKIYATFKKQSFQTYMSPVLSEARSNNKAAHFVASFIVSKQGIADSVKILEGIDAAYDKAFIKAFNKAKKDWIPGKMNGRASSVYMLFEMTYFSSDMAIPSYTYSKDANQALAAQNYELALYYYDKALARLPTDKENLYKRGICKRMLGNQPGACEDWQKVKQLGGTEADTLLATYCK